MSSKPKYVSAHNAQNQGAFWSLSPHARAEVAPFWFSSTLDKNLQIQIPCSALGNKTQDQPLGQREQFPNRKPSPDCPYITFKWCFFLGSEQVLVWSGLKGHSRNFGYFPSTDLIPRYAPISSCQNWVAILLHACLHFSPPWICPAGEVLITRKQSTADWQRWVPLSHKIIKCRQGSKMLQRGKGEISILETIPTPAKKMSDWLKT